MLESKVGRQKSHLQSQLFSRVKYVIIFQCYPYPKEIWISVILNSMIRGRAERREHRRLGDNVFQNIEQRNLRTRDFFCIICMCSSRSCHNLSEFGNWICHILAIETDCQACITAKPYCSKKKNKMATLNGIWFWGGEEIREHRQEE